jgi:hypothetical protein
MIQSAITEPKRQQSWVSSHKQFNLERDGRAIQHDTRIVAGLPSQQESDEKFPIMLFRWCWQLFLVTQPKEIKSGSSHSISNWKGVPSNGGWTL